MNAPRIVVMTAVLLTAMLLDTVVLSSVTVGGWRPALLVLTVVGFALADGPDTGARYGFLAGLAADLLSGGNSVVGLSALTLLIVGDAVGRIRPYLSQTAVAGEMAVAAAAGAVAVVAYGLVSLLLDLRQFTAPLIVQAAIVAALWNLVLGPPTIRGIALLSRRFTVADPTAAAGGGTTRAW